LNAEGISLEEVLEGLPLQRRSPERLESQDAAVARLLGQLSTPRAKISIESLESRGRIRELRQLEIAKRNERRMCFGAGRVLDLKVPISLSSLSVLSVCAKISSSLEKGLRRHDLSRRCH
jgi:hypothetical protein